MSDRELVQLLCALRIFLPDVGIVLDARTRAPAQRVDPLGVTMISAEAIPNRAVIRAQAEYLHRTERGRIVPLTENASEWAIENRRATGQFDIADERSPGEVAATVARLGLEPVWRTGIPRWRARHDDGQVIANGQSVEAAVPCSIEEFLVARGLLPRSVVVEHNGEAVAPSQFSKREIRHGDRLEIVKIVAGG